MQTDIHEIARQIANRRLETIVKNAIAVYEERHTDEDTAEVTGLLWQAFEQTKDAVAKANVAEGN